MVDLMVEILAATKAVSMAAPKADMMAYQMVAKTVVMKAGYWASLMGI